MDFDSITAANQRNSPLLRLPAELRNKIYLYAFDDNKIFLVGPGRARQAFGGSSYPMSLAQTCTQCRHEALPYFWQNTVFRLSHGGDNDPTHHTSQSMRDQIEVVGLTYGGAYSLCTSRPGFRQGSFSRVRKVLWPYGQLDKLNRGKALVEVVRKTFGSNAKLYMS